MKKLTGLLPILALLSSAPVAVAQVRTQPLPSVDPVSARQTGIASLALPDDERVVVRSFEPDTVFSDRYRISFDALDADGDGYIDRTEAAAHATLDGEFRAVDANGDGRLDRDELKGWTTEER